MNGDTTKVIKHSVLKHVPQRKRLPIETILSLDNNPRKILGYQAKPSRKLSADKLRERMIEIQEITHDPERNPSTTLTRIKTLLADAIEPIAQKNRTAKPWFNKRCYEARRITLAALHMCLNNSSQDLKQDYCSKRREKQKY